ASTAAARAWRGLKLIGRFSCGVRPRSAAVVVRRDAQHLAGLDQVGVVKLVAVGLEDRVPFAGLAVETLGDVRQRVATLDGVGLLAAAADDVRAGIDAGADAGEIRRPASGLASGVNTGTDTGEIGFPVWKGHVLSPFAFGDGAG